MFKIQYHNVRGCIGGLFDRKTQKMCEKSSKLGVINEALFYQKVVNKESNFFPTFFGFLQNVKNSHVFWERIASTLRATGGDFLQESKKVGKNFTLFFVFSDRKVLE